MISRVPLGERLVSDELALLAGTSEAVDGRSPSTVEGVVTPRRVRYRPRTDTPLQAEIAAWNEAVDRRKPEKRAKRGKTP